MTQELLKLCYEWTAREPYYLDFIVSNNQRLRELKEIISRVVDCGNFDNFMANLSYLDYSDDEDFLIDWKGFYMKKTLDRILNTPTF